MSELPPPHGIWHSGPNGSIKEAYWFATDLEPLLAEIERLKVECATQWNLGYTTATRDIVERAEEAECEIERLREQVADWVPTGEGDWTDAEWLRNQLLMANESEDVWQQRAETVVRELAEMRADRDRCVKNMNDNAERADALRAQLEAYEKQPTVAYAVRFEHNLTDVLLWEVPSESGHMFFHEKPVKVGSNVAFYRELIERPARGEKSE